MIKKSPKSEALNPKQIQIPINPKEFEDLNFRNLNLFGVQVLGFRIS